MEQIEFSTKKSTRKIITFASTAQTIEIGRFPVGTQLEVNVTTNMAFNNTNTLSVGINSTANNIIDNFNLVTGVGKNSDVRLITTENQRIVYAKINGAATAGQVTITVDYTLPTCQEVNL